MTKAPTPTEMSKGQSDNTNNATKKFDYTVVADRLRTVSWSNYSHPTGVVNRFTGPPSHLPQQPCNRPTESELRSDGWRSPTNNQRGRRSGPCRLWGGLDKARHIVPTALLVRVQCFRKSLYKAVQGPSTRPIVVSMINGSYCRRRRRLTIFEPDEMKFGVSLTLLSL